MHKAPVSEPREVAISQKVGGSRVNGLSVYVGSSRLPYVVVLWFVAMSQQVDCRTVSDHRFDGSGSKLVVGHLLVVPLRFF
ncbi:unnamed protein product [Macrosiphum euphorbiae]|uniref:Uncharacterized protein n=1 Tax=Macrosiphum euphorbiae TaxID=13131 RepID=A0AAV0WEL1_9HEMI|nr:unnamed protein product [Macrosiphum euphorbiae]